MKILALLLCCQLANADSLFRNGFESPWVVPPGRMTGGVVSYPTLGVSPFPSHSVSFDFQKVLGDADPRTPATVPFPGAATSLCINGVQPGAYIALAFVPSDTKAIAAIAAATYGNELSAPLSANVSPNPGDFAGGIVNVGPGNALRKIVVLPYTNGAPTYPGDTFYFNVRHAGSKAHMICLTNSPGKQP